MKSFTFCLALFGISFIGLTICYAQPSERAHYLGRVVESFELKEPATSKRWDFGEKTKDTQATVIYFVGTECPVNNLYVPIVNELATGFAKQGVVFVAINSNAHDTAAEIAEHARDYELKFPVLKDSDGRVAKSLGATRTTEVLVLDTQKKIRFRGRVDDRFERGTLRPRTEKHFLKDALNEVLDGSEVSVPLTSVTGCPIRFEPNQTEKLLTGDSGTDSSKQLQVNFSKHVAPIIQRRCQSCHRPDEIGPFSLMKYRDAVDWSESIREVVTQGLMPPWNAEGEHGHFSNDRRLTNNEYKTLLDWIDGGTVEGDPKDLPIPNTLATRWHIPKPDLVLKMNKSFSIPAATPEGGIPDVGISRFSFCRIY